ncbi:MAG: hypothetical protein SFX18_01930 [Pirellulales bacterium]|nr:hypothetical protein [Pirellulales bacterium]
MDEATKNMVLIPVCVGSITVMILQFAINYTNFSYGMLAVNLLIGAAVGGAVFGALFFMNKR